MTRTVLAVDDSSDDLTLLSMACMSAKVSFRLECVANGEQAIAYLEEGSSQAAENQRPRPDMVLLDLKMPGKSGFDVLAWVRAKSEFGNLPVIVFTSSIHERDRAQALGLGANGFIVKPVGYEPLQQLVRSLDLMLSMPGGFNTPEAAAMLMPRADERPTDQSSPDSQ